MNIGIFTIHNAKNYGAILQTYGLVEVIRRLGHEPYVVNYSCPSILEWYKLKHCSATFNPDSVLSKFVGRCKKVLQMRLRFLRNRRLNNFINSKFNLIDLDCARESLDVCIFGSDQIWNPRLTLNDCSYLGKSFDHKKVKLISYAASAGSIQDAKNFETDFIRYLPKLSDISCREESLTAYLKDLGISNDVKTVIDPVLLGGYEIFNNLTSKPKKKNKYLLCFDLEKSKTRDYARKLAAINNLDYIEIAPSYETLFDKASISTSSIEDFLTYIKYAEYVVTTSFHGTVFSIIFHRNFETVIKNPQWSPRISNLLNMLNIPDRIVTLSQNMKMEILNPIDYTGIDKILKKEHDKSLNFLVRALN